MEETMVIKNMETVEVFDRIAVWYDFINKIMSLGMDRVWRKKASELLDNSGSIRVLDLACGTGEQILSLFSSKLNIISVNGIDTSEKMLTQARKRINSAGLNQIVFLEKGDARELRFKDDFFDAVTMSFGLSSIPNYQEVINEAWRVLKADCPLIILDLANPQACRFRRMYTFYVRHIASFAGGFITGAPDAYLNLRSDLEKLPDIEKLSSQMKCAGFQKLSIQPLSSGAAMLIKGKKRNR